MRGGNHLLVASTVEVKADDGGIVATREIKSGTAHSVHERIYLSRLNLSHCGLMSLGCEKGCEVLVGRLKTRNRRFIYVKGSEDRG